VNKELQDFIKNPPAWALDLPHWDPEKKTMAYFMHPCCSYCRSLAPTAPHFGRDNALSKDAPGEGAACYCDVSPYSMGAFIIVLSVPDVYPFKPPKESILSPILSPYVTPHCEGYNGHSKIGCGPIKYEWSPAQRLVTVVEQITDSLFEPYGYIMSDSIHLNGHAEAPRMRRSCPQYIQGRYAVLPTLLLGTLDQGSVLSRLRGSSYLLERIWGLAGGWPQSDLEKLLASPRGATILKKISKENISENIEGNDTEEGGAHGPVFEINVKTLIGKTITFNMRAAEDIYLLKKRIHKSQGVAPRAQRLIYAGKPLEDGRTFRDYKILPDNPGAMIHMVFHMRCPGDPAAGGVLCAVNHELHLVMQQNWWDFEARVQQHVEEHCAPEQVTDRWLEMKRTGEFDPSFFSFLHEFKGTSDVFSDSEGSEGSEY